MLFVACVVASIYTICSIITGGFHVITASKDRTIGIRNFSVDGFVSAYVGLVKAVHRDGVGLISCVSWPPRNLSARNLRFATRDADRSVTRSARKEGIFVDANVASLAEANFVSTHSRRPRSRE